MDRIIAAVRAEAQLGRLLPLDDPTGQLRITETAAARTLRRAGGCVPGALAAGCRLPPLVPADTRVTVTMTLAVTPDQPLPAEAAQVRRAVAYATAHELGLGIAAEWEGSHPTGHARHAGVGT